MYVCMCGVGGIRIGLKQSSGIEWNPASARRLWIVSKKHSKCATQPADEETSVAHATTYKHGHAVVDWHMQT